MLSIVDEVVPLWEVDLDCTILRNIMDGCQAYCQRWKDSHSWILQRKWFIWQRASLGAHVYYWSWLFESYIFASCKCVRIDSEVACRCGKVWISNSLNVKDELSEGGRETDIDCKEPYTFHISTSNSSSQAESTLSLTTCHIKLLLKFVWEANHNLRIVWYRL